MSTRPPLQVREWLAKPWGSSLPFEYDKNPIPDAATPTVLQVLTCLIYKNGGLDMNGYGVMQSGGLYGSIGLGQREAFCLMQIGNFYRGLLAAHGEDHDDGPFLAELNRVSLIRGMPAAHGNECEK